jgi:IPT/TIG domain
MTMVRYPLPITPAMLQPANANLDKPRYSGGGVAGDWVGGATGNDVNAASANVAVVNAASAVGVPAYGPLNQIAKGNAMVPPLVVLSDIGIDYGTYAGQAGRGGTITPLAPYPDQTSPPVVTSVSPATGLAAGGTAVTVSGWNLTGATGVTFGGTAAAAVTVTSPTTITCTSPAKAAGTYDVRVTTPRGTSPIGGVSDNFIYT